MTGRLDNKFGQSGYHFTLLGQKQGVTGLPSHVERNSQMNSQWYKSSYSAHPHGNCVEGRINKGAVEIRDSKDKSGPRLIFTPEAWTAFLSNIPTPR